MKNNIKELCEEIGRGFGRYFEENGKYCIDNYAEIFRYNTPKELLTDWVDTLICQHLSEGGASGCNWEKEVIFIYNDVIKKPPKGGRIYRGKNKTTYTAEGYINDGTRHGKMIYLGRYDNITDAIGAIWKHEEKKKTNT